MILSLVRRRPQTELLIHESDEDDRFRSTIDMRRYRFGEGQYRYFENPLPAVIDHARHAFYPPLAETANAWAERLRTDEPAYPPDLDA